MNPFLNFGLNNVFIIIIENLGETTHFNIVIESKHMTKKKVMNPFNNKRK